MTKTTYPAPNWSSQSRRRVTKSNPCPACGKPDFCQFDLNENWLQCARPETANREPLGWKLIKAKPGHLLFAKEASATTEPRPAPAIPPAPPTPPPASDELKHAVYSDLLAALSLDQSHRRALTDPNGKRQLTPAEVEAMNIKSAPSREKNIKVCAQLARKYGREPLLKVPGFYSDRGTIKLATWSGLLIPVSNDNSHIHGIRIAPLREGVHKYLWLASTGDWLEKRGLTKGEKADPRAAIFYPLNRDKIPHQVTITEGEFKAFITAQKLGVPVISVPGVGNWQSAKVIELALKVAGKGGTARLAYDSEQNPNTRHHLHQLADALTLAGLRVEIATWDNEGGTLKGIDDLLLAGKTFRTYRYVKGLADLPVNTVIDCEYLPDIKLVKKVTIINARKAGGKSTSIARLCQRLGANESILSIGHRQLLLEHLAKRWELDCYLDFKVKDKMNKEKLTESKRLAICLDSLIHFDTATRKRILIIDEVEQVLRHLTSGTLKKKRRQVLSMLKGLIKRADHVIALDADLSSITYNFFARIVGEDDIEVIANVYKRTDAPPIYQYTDRIEATSKIIKALKAGIKCYIASNSAEETRTLKRMISEQLPQLKGLTVNSDNSAEEFTRAAMRDINNAVKNFDYLIASPSLATGVDISVKHFDLTFVIGVHGSTTASDLLQHAARNRHAKEIHAYIQPGEFNRPTDPEYWKQICIEKAEQTGLLLDYDARALGERIAQHGEQDYLSLWSEIKAAEIASTNKLAENFYTQAEREGHQIKPVIEASQDRTEVIAARIEAREANEAERKEAILFAPVITAQEAAKLDARAYLTPEETAKLEGYDIDNYYGLPRSLEVIEFDDKHRTRPKLNNFMAIAGMIDPAEIDNKLADDNERMLPDLKHYTLQRERRLDLFDAAGITDFISDEFSADSLKAIGFIEKVLAMKHELQRDLDLTVKADFEQKPIEILARAFAQIGLPLKCYRVGERGKQKRIYKIDRASYDTMQHYAKARAAVLAARQEPERLAA